MELRPLRWYERIQETFCMKPQWFILMPDGTLDPMGWCTAKYAKEWAVKKGSNTIVWVPPASNPPIAERTQK